MLDGTWSGRAGLQWPGRRHGSTFSVQAPEWLAAPSVPGADRRLPRAWTGTAGRWGPHGAPDGRPAAAMSAGSAATDRCSTFGTVGGWSGARESLRRCARRSAGGNLVEPTIGSMSSPSEPTDRCSTFSTDGGTLYAVSRVGWQSLLRGRLSRSGPRGSSGPAGRRSRCRRPGRPARGRPRAGIELVPVGRRPTSVRSPAMARPTS